MHNCIVGLKNYIQGAAALNVGCLTITDYEGSVTPGVRSNHEIISTIPPFTLSIIHLQSKHSQYLVDANINPIDFDVVISACRKLNSLNQPSFIRTEQYCRGILDQKERLAHVILVYMLVVVLTALFDY